MEGGNRVIKLKQMMKNKFDDDKGLALKVAKEAGLSSANPLYKFVNEDDREMNDFGALTKVVKILFKEEHRGLLLNYFSSISPNKQSMRNALEYASVFKDKEMLAVILESMKDADNRHSVDYKPLYEIDLNLPNLSIPEAFEKIHQTKCNTDEMHVFSKLIMLYTYIRDAKYNMLKDSIDLVEPMILNLKDSYIKKSFTTRINAIKVSATLNEGIHSETEAVGLKALEANEHTTLVMRLSCMISTKL
jgi:hypothetical protein